MEQAVCLLCGVADERALLRRAKPRHVVCRRCGLVYQNPRPTLEEISAYYQRGYWEDRGPIAANGAEPIRPASLDRGRFVVEWTQKYLGSVERVVEIGCGRGEILAYVRDHLNCQALGVEPSRAQATTAAQRFALEVLNATLNDVDLQGRKASALVLSHVVEHFHDPRAALIRCRDLLADGGWIFIEVPNILEPNRHKGLSKWLAFEHMYYFSVGTLSRVLAEAGFAVEHTETKAFVRVLAQMQPAVPKGSAGISAVANEYRDVLRALRRHEYLYWPRYAVQRAAGLLSRGRAVASSSPEKDQDD
jgi:SAM-dependent methyltransferase